MPKRLTTEEFISKAREVHGDKYDYSKTVYVDAATKVCIICPEHGEFFQLPHHHLKGHGCKKCAFELVAEKAKKSVDEFLLKAKEIHGDKYDYSKVLYKNSLTKVCIVCPEHGEFWQTPANHLQGQGCPKCLGKNKSTEDFISEAKKVHGDKYDYSKTKYKGAGEKVCIICPKHGEFWQIPSSHLRGSGCPECGKERSAELQHAKMPTTEEFVAHLVSIYGNKYDFSKVDYKGNKTKVCIICPEHGEFWKTPSALLAGQGCPRCNKSAKDITTEEFITKARKVHGDKYDYSKVVYTKANENVCIICPEHGEFWMQASRHLQGSSCPRCWYPNANLTTEEFIEKSRQVHGDKYDYSKVVYKDTKTKVCIICPEHGEFWQIPSLHLSGTGCPNCHGYRKTFKFNLLQEFENEYAFREFLANNDIKILQVILRNIEPKYEPLKKDIEKALANVESMNPIRALEEKYSSNNGDDEEPIVNEPTTREEPIQNTPDLDDDDAMSEFINTMSGNNEQEDKKEPTIEEITRNREEEIKVINRIEHMLTPEDREYIMDKFLHDKRKAWMAERERNK